MIELFVAFGAEEMGLLGSKYFVNSNLISNERIQIMMNLDMVGRLNSEKTINVSGTKTAANLESIITPHIKNNGLNFTFSSPQKRNVRVAMSNTFGFGGHYACVIFKEVD